MDEMEEKPHLAQHKSNVDNVDDVKNVDAPLGQTKQVFNVALADALAKDNTSAWAPSMLKLYAIIAFSTLGRWTLTPCCPMAGHDRKELD